VLPATNALFVGALRALPPTLILPLKGGGKC
jgi:hypothetical protein